ncbi:MAG: tetratricopeptide repeat protein [Fimbriimonadaceae bacterium]|nr:MAG: tetratricopeptide repeat protein [Fimbriimonadaceae bacterium]
MREEAAKLLIDGRQLLNDGRTHEAVMVAESVLEVNPTDADALALLGDIYERDGQLSEALETYEKVCELRPDSAIDRIRAAHLRKLVAAEEFAVDVPSERKRSLLLVAAAGVLLTSVGAAFFFASTGQPTVDKNLVAKNDPTVAGFAGLSPTLVPNVPPKDMKAEVDNSTSGTSSVVGVNNNPGYDPKRTTTGPGRDGNPEDYRPYQPTLGDWPVNLTQQNPSLSTNNPNNNQPSTAKPADEPPKDPVAKEEDDPGIIEMKVNPGSSSNSSGGTAVDNLSAEQLIQKARNLYVQENYAGAAAAYEQAIKAGANTGATYQRLAQCYEKLGKRSNAIQAYRQAISAFDNQIARGNASSSVRAAKESCEKAIAALGG